MTRAAPPSREPGQLGPRARPTLPLSPTTGPWADTAGGRFSQHDTCPFPARSSTVAPPSHSLQQVAGGPAPDACGLGAGKRWQRHPVPSRPWVAGCLLRDTGSMQLPGPRGRLRRECSCSPRGEWYILNRGAGAFKEEVAFQPGLEREAGLSLALGRKQPSGFVGEGLEKPRMFARRFWRGTLLSPHRGGRRGRGPSWGWTGKGSGEKRTVVRPRGRGPFICP